MMRTYFEALADAVCVAGAGLDRVSLSLAAETSDFLRFNRGRVRQAGQVQQCHGSVTVVAGARRSTATTALTGDLQRDAAVLCAEREQLARELPLVPEDPWLLLPQAVTSSERDSPAELPSAGEVIRAVAAHATGTDLVGFLASGPLVRAYADSRGQRNWHRVGSFHFEWCLYREGDLAVKSTYAGSAWDPAGFAGRMESARQQLEVLGRPRRRLSPGAYRAYFSPVAVADLLSTLSWGGFGERGVRTGMGSLVQLYRGERQLHPSVRLSEDPGHGLAPDFLPEGFSRPSQVLLVDRGRAVSTLVSPRSAREYGVAHNSGSGETPDALSLAPGALPVTGVLPALGTGVFLSDLHYLNYSDRQACRMTGMTRFACLWVEDGVPVAPIEVMRFDDSLLRMFGEGLAGLTDRAELVPDNATYGARQLRSVRAPGALVEGFVFTL